jgi:hypothetical protein
MMTTIRSTVLPLAVLMTGNAAALADSSGGVGVLTVAIGRYNAQIRSFAASDPRIARTSTDHAGRATLSGESVLVAGRGLDRHRPADDMDGFFLADGGIPGHSARA